jgi:hypothetical protein
VPLTTLQPPKLQGGWNFINIEAKCRAVLYNRITQQSNQDNTALSIVMRFLKVLEAMVNPPNINRIPRAYPHLREYVRDMAYLEPAHHVETPTRYRRRVYHAMFTMRQNETTRPIMRIQQKHPGVKWNSVWSNLHTAPVSTSIRIEWYCAIHDIVPTNHRLFQIHLANTPSCSSCGQEDTFDHRLTDCGEASCVLNCTRTLLGQMLRSNPSHIPKTWTS